MVKVKGATLQATALKAEDVLDGLREVVDLLKSRPMLPMLSCCLKLVLRAVAILQMADLKFKMIGGWL